MLYSDYEHLVLYRQRREELEKAYRAGAGRRIAGRRRRHHGRALAHGLGTALISAGRMLQSL